MMYEDRLKQLVDAADDEGIEPPSDCSKRDFETFISTRGFPVRKAALFLRDDGTLAACWRDDKWRLDVSFPGNGSIKYFLLSRKEPAISDHAEVEIAGFGNMGRDMLIRNLIGNPSTGGKAQ